jgi:hypothetical protein
LGEEMKHRIFILFLIAVTLICNYKLNAQSGGINFTLGFPMGDFKDNVARTGFGLSGQFLLWNPRPELPFSFGLNAGFINYGNESRREPFSETIPDVTVDVDRSNNIVNFHLLFLIGLPSGVVRPFIEGLFGGSYIFTETSIKSRGVDEVASSTNFDDFAWSYGGGAGFLIQVSSGADDEEIGALFIELKARYLFGTEAEYLKEGSVKIVNRRVTYDITRSKTDLLTAHIGVVAYFNSIQ